MAQPNPPAPQQNPPVGRQTPQQTSPAAAPTIAGQPVTMAQLPASSPAVATGDHYRGGKLTRAGMEHVIRSGGSVVHDGRIISSIAHLPSEADLAGQNADPAELERIRRQNEAEIERLRRENADLKAQQVTAEKAAATPPAPDAPQGDTPAKK